MKLFLIFFTYLTITASAQTTRYLKGAPFITNFTYKDFKGEPQVWSSVQDKFGIMYFANASGVITYDGARWSAIKGDFNGVVRSLAYDPKSNRIYLGARNLIGYLEENKNGIKIFHKIEKPNNIKDVRLKLVDHVQMYQGSAYFVTDNALVRHRDTTTVAWTFPGKISSIHNHNSSELLFLVGGEGIYHIVNGQPEKYIPNNPEFKLQFTFSDSIGLDEYLLFSISGKFSRMNKNGLSALSLDLPISKNYPEFYRGAKVNDSLYALATLNKGILFFNKTGKLFDWITEENGLINNNVKHLTIDKDGNIWASTEKGISFIEYSTPVRNISKQFKLDAIVESSFIYGNKLYIGTGNGAFLVQKSNGENPFIPELKPLENVRAQVFSLVRVNDYLLASTGDGFYQLEPTYRKFSPDSYRSAFLYPLPSNPNFVLAGLIDGIAVLHFENKMWKVLGRLNGIKNETWTIAEDRSGYIWSGTKSEGVHRFRFNLKNPLQPDSLTSFSTANSNLPNNDTYVHMIKNYLVISSHGSLVSFDTLKNSFVPFTELGTDFTTGVKWLERIQSTSQGKWIYIYGTTASPEFNSIFETYDSFDLTMPSPTNFSRLSNTLIYTMNLPASNSYWFGGPDGLFRFTAQVDKPNNISSLTSIREITVDSDSTIRSGSLFRDTFTEPVVLQYPINQIRFSFTTLDFVMPEYRRYQYFLENYDTKWSEWSDEIQKDYTNIPSGKYRFLVRSKTVSGILAETDFVDLIILPPWYLTSWMIIFYVLLFVGIVYLIVRWRTIRLQNMNKNLELAVKDKTNQLLQSEKMAAFGQIASGLSHELNNPLTVVSMNLESLKLTMDSITFPDDLTKSNFSKSINDSFYGIDRMANIIQSMKLLAFTGNRIKAKTKINSEIDETLRLYFSNIENIRFSKKYSDIPDVMINTGDFRRSLVNLFLNSIQAIQEAYKKGKLLDHQGHISVETVVRQSDEHQQIIILIFDNGIGFPDDIAKNVFDPFFTTKEIGAGKGLGLSETFSLIQSMNGEIKINSSENQGTVVQILLPVSDQIV